MNAHPAGRLEAMHRYRRLGHENGALNRELVNWDELSNLYRIAPLGDKNPG